MSTSTLRKRNENFWHGTGITNAVKYFSQGGTLIYYDCFQMQVISLDILSEFIFRSLKDALKLGSYVTLQNS